MSILSGVENGLKKGAQYISDVARCSDWALRKGKTDILKDCIAVGTAFVQEMTDEAGLVTTHAMELVVGAALGLNHDPNAGSRKLAQDVLKKAKAAGFK